MKYPFALSLLFFGFIEFLLRFLLIILIACTFIGLLLVADLIEDSDFMTPKCWSIMEKFIWTTDD